MAMHWHRQRCATTSTHQKHPAFGGSNRSPGGVAVLARCKGIAPRTAPTRKTDLFPSNCFLSIMSHSKACNETGLDKQ